jgi:hypothetical protein
VCHFGTAGDKGSVLCRGGLANSTGMGTDC